MTNKTAKRLTRILSMLPWVIANPGATVDDVQERFGYSRRELVADLDLVFVCGLPGYGPGDLMEAYIEDDEVIVDMADYFSRPLRLNAHEALTLLASGMALTSSGQAPPALERAVDKLAAVVAPDVVDALFVDLAGAEPETREALRQAATRRNVVDLTYTALSTGTTTRRLLEPWSVFSSMGNWYVTGLCRTAMAERVFRVDRVRAVNVTSETFEAPDQLPPPEVRYMPSEEDVRATIRLGPTARWVSDYYPVDDISDGVIEFSASDPAVAARLLLRLGRTAELLEGDEVRASLDSQRQLILQRYNVD